MIRTLAFVSALLIVIIAAINGFRAGDENPPDMVEFVGNIIIMLLTLGLASLILI